jgi:hypothetical protein
MININEFDFELLTLVKSGRAVKVMYNNNPLEFITPTLYSPFGVKSIKRDWSMFEDYSIDCSLHNEKTIASAIEFSEFLKKLHERIQKLCKDNWGSVDTKGVSSYDNTTFNSILKENKTYPKLMKLNFVRDKNGNFTSFVFDEDKKKILINEDNITEILTRGRRFRCIIECAKIWLFNDKIGTIWNINQLKLSSKSDDIDITSDDLEQTSDKVDYSKNLID